MKRLLLFSFLLFSGLAMAQVNPQISGAGAPSNPCFNGGQQYVDTTNHVIYNCPSTGGNWALIGIGNQGSNTVTTSASGAPAGNCTSTTQYYVNTANGDFYDCPTPGSSWVKAGNTSAGGGTVTTTGTPANGNLAAFTGGTSISNTDLTGDATTSGTNAVTVGRINGTSLAGLATGILKNTTTTGVPSIAVAGDFPTLNQNTTGTSATSTAAGPCWWGGTTGGSANALTITVPGIHATITTGDCISGAVSAASTGATTINVTPTGGSAYGTVNLMKRTTGGVAALGASGDLPLNAVFSARYDGTEWVLEAPSSTIYTGGSLTAGTIVRGNSNNQVQGSSGMAAGTGAFTTYNSETLAAQGFAYMRGATAQKSESGADTNVLTVTPPAQVGTYRACISMQVSAQNTATLGWTMTWTDSNGSAQAPTNLALTQTGVAAPALTFSAATNGNYWGCNVVDINNAGTGIVVKTTFSGTSITYKASASIERIQ